jgi:hypothetical protein
MRIGILAVLICLAISPFAFAAPTNVSFNSIGGQSDTGGVVQIAGTTLTFPNAVTGFDFDVENCTGCATNLDSLPVDAAGQTEGGNIDGTFTIGAITTNGATQSANVSGIGVFSMTDLTGHVWSAALNWETITTTGTGTTLNVEGLVNVGAATYTGTNADLLALKNMPGGMASLNFIFIPGLSLTQLTDGTTRRDNYSGNYVPTPEPSFYGILAIGILGVIWTHRRQRRVS